MQQNSTCDQISNISHYYLPGSPLCLTPTNDDVKKQKPTRIKRPMNPFMIWSTEKRKEVAKENPRMHNSHISKLLGEEWKKLPQETKQIYIDKADQVREEHRKQYPDYRYRPRKRMQTTSLNYAPESFSQELPTNCINDHPNPMSFNYISPFIFNNYLSSILLSSIHSSHNPEEQRLKYLMSSQCPSSHFHDKS